MSGEPALKTNQETLQFMEKVEDKKKIVHEAEAEYNQLCAEVEKASLELSGLKMERFKVEGLNQELDIRVKVHEVMEKELKEQDERAKRSIKEAKSWLDRELEVRDSFNRNSSLKVIEMASAYSHLKDSCFKTNVLACLSELKSSHSTFTSEIETKMQELGLDSEEQNGIDPFVLLQQVYQPKMDQRHSLSAVCEIQKLVQAEVNSMRAKNVNAIAHVDMLLEQTSNLLKEVDSLKKPMNK